MCAVYLGPSYNIINSLFSSDFRNTDEILYYLGSAYGSMENYDLMKKYYLMAINKGNTYAMIELGNYYKKKTKYSIMKKYFLKAINNGNRDGFFSLGYYYQYIQYNYNLAKKYYLFYYKYNKCIFIIHGIYRLNRSINYSNL